MTTSTPTVTPPTSAEVRAIVDRGAVWNVVENAVMASPAAQG
jgi:hypothetical protein